MQKTIEVVYEKGMFKPLEPVELEEGGKAKLTIEREKGVITSEDIEELRESIRSLPKSKINLKRVDEIYHEGKMLDWYLSSPESYTWRLESTKLKKYSFHRLKDAFEKGSGNELVVERLHLLNSIKDKLIVLEGV